jgi:hypothetical protein
MLTLSQRLFLAAVGSVALGGACGSDDVEPLEPVSYELSIDAYNGAPGDAVALRCDGTLTVTVSIAPSNAFTLRPANACGSSTRCGYVHFELLSKSGDVLAFTDSATREGVLRVPGAVPIDDLGGVRVSLRSGVDDETIVNADGKDAVTSEEPRFDPPASCDGAGGAGAGGAPSEPGVGGADPGGAGGLADPGGAGQGGAAAGQGGASQGGAAAGQGGAAAGQGGAGGQAVNAGAGGA